ncbi:MAG TPA: plastocyanin/azurin family copper-binding protein [Gemmatimonadales bacterium]|nr:plastocyanin/azurin family copper-binding protein [Gemmatimonadales bacterium]
MARLLLLPGLLLLAAAPLAAQQTHVVRLSPSVARNVFRFSPGKVTVKPGDVVEFRAEAGTPYVVAFEPADLDPRGQGLLAAALARPRGELRTPVLADSGSRFRLTVPALRRGSYRFFCLTHLAYRMAGTLVVE